MSFWNFVFGFIGVFQIVIAELSNYSFPEQFKFGVASSAYQIEGAWNEGGKGESMWDYYLHSNPDYIDDKSNGDISCDSYHKWREDIALLKNLGVHFYRFSISWTRILPLGYKASRVNEEGVKFYNDVIDALLAEGIKPYVTIYHWDLPQTLQKKGGWLNETIVEDFAYYAKLLFELYGDRVKHWITINEFLQMCDYPYSNGTLAPFIKLPGTGVYQCSHHALLAHGRVYRIYQNEFKPLQKGEVGASIQGFWCDPKTNSTSDQLAAEQFMQFNFGFYAHPIVYGNYPPIMIERVAALSKRQGYNQSRLPTFTDEQIEMMKGSLDFFGLNHYTTLLCTFNDNFPQPSFDSDTGVGLSQDPAWEGRSLWWLRHVPRGFRKVLVWIKQQYKNPTIHITENGWSTDDVDLNDIGRVKYFEEYLSEMLKAIYEDGCLVAAYAAWTLMDDFEWTSGYTKKFGLVHVDFESANKTRVPRRSYEVYKKIISSMRIPNAAPEECFSSIYYVIFCCLSIVYIG